MQSFKKIITVLEEYKKNTALKNKNVLDIHNRRPSRIGNK